MLSSSTNLMPRQLSTARRSHPTYGRWSVIQMTHLYHSYIPLNSSITTNWNTFILYIPTGRVFDVYHSVSESATLLPVYFSNYLFSQAYNILSILLMISMFVLKYSKTLRSRSQLLQLRCLAICFTIYRYWVSQHLSPLINLSAFAEHLTGLFPVVGGPRAFAQPKNFYHLLLLNRFYQCETFQPSLSLQAGSYTV